MFIKKVTNIKLLKLDRLGVLSAQPRSLVVRHKPPKQNTKGKNNSLKPTLAVRLPDISLLSRRDS